MTVSACQQSKQPLVLVTEDLKYSAYAWYYTSGYWEFYVDYFISVDKSGHFNLMLRDSIMSKPKYFKGGINDTISNLIDKTFSIDTFKTDYKSNALQNIAYDGFTYCLDYKKIKDNRKRIIFIKRGIPYNIQKLSMLLETVNDNSKPKQVDTINITTYIDELKSYSSVSLGPLPTVEYPKVEYPKVKRKLIKTSK